MNTQEPEPSSSATDESPQPDEPDEGTPEEEAEDDGELVERAKDCYRTGIDATAKWREDALEDLAFLAGEQWDANIKGMRDAQGRPALTVNRLPQFVRQITNEQRQSKPAVTVSPVDDGSDKQTAEVLQGIIRNVEYTSNADAAYAAGGESAAITGLGYWDVCAEYEDEKSFDQRLLIKRVPNPLSVVLDPGAKEVAGDDARWCIISMDVGKGEWETLFPGKEMPKSTGWEGQGDGAASWVAKDGVRIHEYRYITEEPDELIQLPPGIFQDAPEGEAALASELEPKVLAMLKRAKAQTRPTTRRKACFAKIAGDEVIEKGDLGGRFLQLVRVVGTELEIGDGATIYEGIIRHAKDTQRMLNYFVSAEAEAIALAPKAPFIGTVKQIEGYEKLWENANQRPTSFLPFNVDPGFPTAPQRVMAEANVQAITNARMQAADDLKAVTGIYDAALGARSNEQSGKAILARQSQGQTATFHFQDNLAMAIRLTGRILIDLIPTIYSGPRVLRILGEDGKHDMVPVNQPGQFKGEDVHIALDAGRYDVAVSMGPSYHSRRQEAAAQLLELIKVNPAISQIAGDLLVEAMDIPNGDAIAERLRKMLPPDIRPPDEKQPPQQVLAQQLEQATLRVQQLAQALHQAHDRLDTEAVANESKERIELIKVHAALVTTAATLDSKESIAHIGLLTREAERISQRLGMADLQPQQPQPEPPPQPQMNGAPNAVAG